MKGLPFASTHVEQVLDTVAPAYRHATGLVAVQAYSDQQTLAAAGCRVCSIIRPNKLPARVLRAQRRRQASIPAVSRDGAAGHSMILVF